VPTPSAMPASQTDLLIDFILMKGTFDQLWFVHLFIFCFIIALGVRAGKPASWWKGAAQTCMCSYGGGSLASMILGLPAVWCALECAMPFALTAYTVSAYWPYGAIPKSKILRGIFSTTYELMRAFVVFGAFTKAVNTLKPSAYYPVPVCGPILCALVGGVGGGFLPPSLGFAPLDNGLNWRFRTAFFLGIWLQLTHNDPNVKPYISPYGLDDPATAKAIGAGLIALLPLLSLAIPPLQPLIDGVMGPNPFTAGAHDAPAKSKKA